MEQDALNTYIIDRLGRGEKESDLVLEVCQRANLSWQEAQKLVVSIRESHRGEIDRRQFPLMFFLALAIFIGGIGLLVYGSLGIFSALSSIQPAAGGSGGASKNIDALARLALVFSSLYRVAAVKLFSIIFGAGMVLGSLLGMRDAWEKMLPS